MVAAEQARLQERERFLERELRSAQQSVAPNMATIDEDTATRLLGEEAARVLTTAREAATQIRQRAEDGSSRLLREATDEAQRLREEAEIEAARRRQDAAADSEAELQMAKQQGRDMVNEARAYRERVLSELARRRELARQQIEQLIHGRDRLLQAFERSRIAAVEVMAELTPLGESDEYVSFQPTTGPVPITAATGMPVAMPSGQPDLSLVPDLPDFDDDRDGTIALSLQSLATSQGDLDQSVAESGDGFDVFDGAESTADIEPENQGAEEADADEPEAEEPGIQEGEAEEAETEPTDASVDEIEEIASVEGIEVVDEPDFFLDDSATPLDENWSPPLTAYEMSSATVATSTVVPDRDHRFGETFPVDPSDGNADDAPDNNADNDVGNGADDDADNNVVELFASGSGDVSENPSSAEIEHDAAGGGTVDDLFARLRAARSDAVARKVNDERAEPSETIDTEAPSVEAPAVETPAVETPSGEEPAFEEIDEFEGAVGTEAPLVDPDEALIPIIVAVARKLKRVLADEQNELLDTLRRKEPVRSIDVLLPWDADQSDRYANAVEADLVSASVAGAHGNDDARNPALVRPASDAVTNEIVAPLRERLTRCIDRAEGNNTDLSNQVRSLYREWKTHRIDEHVETIVRLAFDRGALTVTSS